MKICYIDAFSGISGDMFVGALADAGADTVSLAEALSSLIPAAAFQFEKVSSHGIGATKFRVIAGEEKKHRHLSHILGMIERARLPEDVKKDASAVFRRLGEAEAAVHQAPIEKVHFHEVGAVDSIADIVGACLALRLLGVEAVYSSPLNLGGGTVETEHGVLPVPAPATALLVTGRPVYSSGARIELTTPTGAALATTVAREFGTCPPMRISTVGYGAGDHDLPHQANILRVLIGEASGAVEATTVSVIEANIDDLSPQVLGYAMDRLLEQGALDVTFSPLLMKKNRPGTLVRVVARPEDREVLTQLLFAETTTLGLRIYSAERRVQSRGTVKVETPYGQVRMKISGEGSYAPEYDDCRKLARERGVPLRQVFAEASLAYLKIRK